MAGRLAIVTMLAMLLSGCDQGEAPVPQVPAPLVQHPEPPIGSALNHRMVQASRATLQRLEPAWGRFHPTIYTVDVAQAGQIEEAIRSAMPAGWQEEDLKGFTPPGARLLVFSHGRELFAAMIVDADGEQVVPVLVLRNDALAARAKQN
ncbi:hypothetical protein ABVV53_10155 [Novosphingobium sp. RD2P27]|uniref:Uncharacterized protein n=1 Tax=Novosphingobium kalidii TaxID=3230299 RepID=A0ABV2D1S8_9SPHN